MSTATHRIQADAAEIERALRLMIPQGQVTELRAIEAESPSNRWPHVARGYYDDLAKMAKDAAEIIAKGVYFTPNPVIPALLARCANRYRPAGKNPTTADHDIERRTKLLIDCDPIRPAGIGSTDDEHTAAIERTFKIRAALDDAGWPEPIVADSGNGGHLIYAINLPAGDGGLVARCLEALDMLFSDEQVKVDTTVHNPARIWKLPGTVAAKGDDTPDRPHRLARVIEAPSALAPVTQDQLEALAAKAPQPEAPPASSYRNGHVATFNLDEFIARQFPDANGPIPWKGNGRRWKLPTCPFNSDHTDNSAYIVEQPGGAIGAGCSHNSCTWGWKELRQKLEPKPNGTAKRSREGNGHHALAGSIASLEELPTFGNANRISAGEHRETIHYSMTEIIDRCHQLTGNKIMRHAARLFFDDGQGKGISYFGKPGELFGWLARYARIEWSQGIGCVTKEEFFAELLRTAPAFVAVEEYPHFPPLADHYYAHRRTVPGDGKHLAELLERFCPESQWDADLLKAATVTTTWGGPCGARPVFAFTSADGRGSGKTKTAQAIAALVGGVFEFSMGEDPGVVKTRLLTREASSKRVALFDNVKSHRISNGEAEGLVTSREISGRQLYVGEASRPNSMTWFMTVNGPAMSKDFAQRSVIIRLTKPVYCPLWEEETFAYIEEHRWKIISDIAAFFKLPAVTLERCSRWGAWERSVLARMPEPEELQTIIAERQAAIDADDDEAGGIEDYFAQQLEALDYDPATDTVHVPTFRAAQWYGVATGNRVSPTALTRTIKQAAEERTLKQLRLNPCRSHGRGLLWSGTDFTVHYDLETRIRSRHLTSGDWR